MKDENSVMEFSTESRITALLILFVFLYGYVSIISDAIDYFTK